MTLTKEQIELLNQPIDVKNVETRDGNRSGTFQLSYVEGWHVIDEANRIFGFDGWSCETISTTCVHAEPNSVTYIAKVKITVGDIVKEGTGAGHGNQKQGIGINHEAAIKEAETDAKKRALINFGYQFGLSLYDGKKAWKTTNSSNKKPKKEEYTPPKSQKSTTFVLAKQAIEKCTELKKLDSYTDTFNDRLNEGKITKEEYSKLTDLLEHKYVNLTEQVNS